MKKKPDPGWKRPKKSPPLCGKRYIAYARCASTEQSPQKLERQIRLIRRFGGHQKMRCVGEVRISGVNGWSPPLRPDLCVLLARKCNQDDFDALVMQDYARLTRAEQAAAERIEALFALCGVQIICVATWDAHKLLKALRRPGPQRVTPRGSDPATPSPTPGAKARSR